MRTRLTTVITTAAGVIATLSLGSGLTQEVPVAPFAAVPTERGNQDLFGAYDIDPSWPKDIANLPGHEAWTFGAGQGVFAESPDRIIYLQRGELPNLETPELSVEGNAIPLEGQIGVQRISHGDIIGVSDYRRHRVVDVDVFPENTRVP